MLDYDELRRELKKIHKNFIVRENPVFSVAGMSLGLTHFPEIILSCEKLLDVRLPYNEIEKIKNLDIKFHLTLRNNKIKSISNINTNGFYLDLAFNKIRSLKGLTQTGDIYITGNPLTNLDGFEFNKNYSFIFDGVITVYEHELDLIEYLELNKIKHNIVQRKYNKV